MTSLFEGVSGLLNDVFGAPVTYTPKGGTARRIQSIFRARPVVLTDPDGREVLSLGATWRVQRPLVPELGRGDQIVTAQGTAYLITNWAPSGSPAEDGFLICDLEKVFA